MRALKIFGLILFALISCKKDCDTNPSSISESGCGDFSVYSTQTVPNHEHAFVMFRLMKDSVNLTKSYQSFDLATNPFVITAIEAFNQSYQPYCTDVVIPGFEMTNKWEVQSGKAEVRIVRDKNECEFGYVVDVIIRNATYQDSTGNTITITEKVFDNVLVGWYAG